MINVIFEWKIQTILIFTASGLSLPGFIISLFYYFKKRFLPALFLGFSCFFSFTMTFTYGLADFSLNKQIFFISALNFIPLGFFIVLLIDSINSESIDPKKITIISFISGALFFACFDPNSFSIGILPNGDWSVIFSGYLMPIISVLNLLIGFLLVYYMAKIYWNAPRDLKVHSFLCLIGSLLLGVVAAFLVIAGINLLIPGIHMVVFGIGILISTYFFATESKLAYILPFKVFRLAIIESNGGIPIYTYTWSEKEKMSDVTLFSGMMQAINQFVNESLGKGDVKEIHLEEAILIIKRSDKYPIISVLVASKSSKILRETLHSFTERFLKDFSRFFSYPINTDHFQGASKLILDCFPFVPKYD